MYTTFIYDGSFNGLMSAVYDAFYTRLPVEKIYIADMNTSGDMLNMFDNNIITETVDSKAQKVISSLIKKTSYDSYHNIYMVYMSSFYEHKADLIFKYIKLCFSLENTVYNHISHPVIADINRISKRVSHETHKLKGFIRFQEIQGGGYFSKISPENNQLELVAPHFVDRLFNENWIIYDDIRKQACVHHAQKNFIITDDIPEDILNDDMDKLNTKEEFIYQSLWKAFFDAIAIKERLNPRCQMNLMPKRYWKNMPEVKDKL